nr:hypothetical protein [Tanacetum cinerariifolium]
MSTQQDIYAAGSENRPSMLNKENYVPWLSRLLRYAKSRPNEKFIHTSIINGPYVRRMIPEPGDTKREVPVNETFHVQTDDELTERNLNRLKQMMKGSDIGIQEKKPSCSINGKEKTASNIKFLNNLQPEWSRHVTIVHQEKDLHTADYTQLYDFLKYNQKEVDELKAKRFAKTQDPLALMATYNNPYNFLVLHKDQPSFNQNYMQQPMPNPKDITDLITTMNMALTLMAKAFKLNHSTPTNDNKRISSNPCNRQIAQPGNLNRYNVVQNVRNQVAQNAIQKSRVQNIGNQNGLIGVPENANQNLNGNGNLVAARAEGNAAGYNGNQIRSADLDDIEEVNANCILMANLLQVSTSGTQTDKAPIYDSDRSAEVHEYENYYDNEIFNMFTQEDQYTELLEPIPEPLQVSQNDNNVISEVTSMELSGGTVEQHHVNVEETRALYDSLYHNLAIEVEKVNTVNRKLKETTAELTTELARFKNQEKCFEINKKIKALHLSFGKQIMTLNEEISDLNKQLSKENSTISFLLEEKKKLKSDFKIREDELLDKQIQIKKKIKELDNILVKTGQSIQMIHMLSPKPDSFYHTEQKMALGYQNPCYLKQAQKKQQSLYDGKTKFVGDLKSLAKEADESFAKHKALELEIECLLKAVVSQDIMINPFREEKYVPNIVRANARTKPITVSQPPVFTKKDVNSDLNGLSSTGVDKTKTRRPRPRNNTKNDRVPLRLRVVATRIKDVKLATQIVKSKVVYAMCKQCLISVNHDVCLLNYVNAKSSRGQLCDSNLEVAFRRNACFVRNLEGVDLLSGNHTTNLYTINLHDMASASPIFLMARASSTKSWLWHQRQRLHLLYMDLCGPMRIANINGKRITILLQSPVIIIRTDNGIEFKNQVLKEYFVSVGISHQVSSVRTPQQNGVVERRNQTLVEATRTMLIFSRQPLFLWAEAIATACFIQNRSIIHRLPKFKYHSEHLCSSCEQGKSKRASHPHKLVPNSRQRLHLLHMDLCGPMRIASINGKRKPDISFFHVFGVLCYLKNDREDIGKLGAKGDIRIFIGYFADSFAFRVYNRRTNKIMENMNVSFDELLAMAFEQRSSKPGLQSMTSRQICLGLDLTYAPSTITTQQPTEGELDLLFEAMYDDYIGGQP